MKVAVYICRCGGNISDKIDIDTLRKQVEAADADEITVTEYEFPCSEDGQAFVAGDLKEKKPDRVVFAACSPREHETTFRSVMTAAGMNPYLMQMTNIREHVTWVTADAAKATAKCVSYVKGAIARAKHHVPLAPSYIDVNLDALVIGAGPAGMKAALAVAEAGRKVILVEKRPVLGGLPVQYDEVFPNMECGPCMLEPVLGQVLNGPYAKNIEVLTLSEVNEVVGFFGNFTAKITKHARYIDTQLCIGCQMCIPDCPAETANEFNYGLGTRKAVAFAFQGGLPNVPFIDAKTCVRMTKGENCEICRVACPVEGTVKYDDQSAVVERKIGSILVAIGGSVYDVSHIANLGYGNVDDVLTSLQFERLAASNGPTEGHIQTKNGEAPRRVAIVHCAGSLDKNYKEYCSQVCCSNGFKISHLLHKKTTGAKVVHYVKTICVAGKEEYKLYDHARHDPDTAFVRYDELAQLAVEARPDGGQRLRCEGDEARDFDMVILLPPLVPGSDVPRVSKMLDLSLDKHGFFEELHGRMDSSKAKVRGIYFAGLCQSPMDVPRTINQGVAAAGFMLSTLVDGRKLEIEPVTASVDEARCSGCKSCIPVCPYKAIAFEPAREIAVINPVLCAGCGTCVATCPSSSITGNHFTNTQILAELAEVLA